MDGWMDGWMDVGKAEEGGVISSFPFSVFLPIQHVRLPCLARRISSTSGEKTRTRRHLPSLFPFPPPSCVRHAPPLFFFSLSPPFSLSLYPLLLLLLLLPSQSSFPSERLLHACPPPPPPPPPPPSPPHLLLPLSSSYRVPRGAAWVRCRSVPSRVQGCPNARLLCCIMSLTSLA